MAVVAADIKALSEAFEGESDEKIELFIDIASSEIKEAAWPSGTFDKALKLLTAHYLTMASRDGGASGPLSSVKVGQVSVSYGSPSNAEKLSLTSWGQLFLQLRDANICSAMVV